MEPIFGNFDLALISLYLFWAFFIGLVIWLQRENMREGYPMVESDGTTETGYQGQFGLPSQKTFKLPHGRGELTVPDPARELARERADLALEQTGPAPGDPFEPTGDPMADGVGPASWCNRRDEPELDGHGHAKIVPMRVAEDFAILDGQRDPRGMPVIGGDGEQAGTISDVWIDKPEMMIRFLEIELTGGDKVLAPMTLAWIKRDSVKINALYAAQFPGIPRTKSPDQVTLLEEEKIAAYYCGGKLYADTNRQEPLL